MEAMPSGMRQGVVTSQAHQGDEQQGRREAGEDRPAAVPRVPSRFEGRSGIGEFVGAHRFEVVCLQLVVQWDVVDEGRHLDGEQVDDCSDEHEATNEPISFCDREHRREDHGQDGATPDHDEDRLVVLDDAIDRLERREEASVVQCTETRHHDDRKDQQQAGHQGNEQRCEQHDELQQPNLSWTPGHRTLTPEELVEGSGVEIRRFTTFEAAPGELKAIRAILERAFDGEFSDDDWDHSVGGWHVVGLEGATIVSHASVVRRTLHVGDASVDTGYVEAVATHPDRQGLGFGTAVMRKVARLITARHQFGALSTGERHFYERLGWERWLGPSFVRAGGEMIRTAEEDDGIMVLRFGPSARLDLKASISCEARSGDDW